MPAILKPILGSSGGGGGGGGDFLPLAGGTMTGPITLAANATAPLNPVTFQQFQAAQFGFLAHPDVKAATAAAITGTYNNGTAGVGATITVTATGANAVDGYTTALNDRILIQSQAAPAQNGIYTASTLGDTGISAVYTRATDFNTVGSTGVATGAYVIVKNGSTYLDNTIWMSGVGPFTIGTTAITWEILTIPTALTFIGNLSQTGNNVDFANPFTEDANFGAFFARFNSGAGIKDANGNSILLFTPTATPINRFSMTNAATGNSPVLSVNTTSGTAPGMGFSAPSGIFNFTASTTTATTLRLNDNTHAAYVGLSVPSAVTTYNLLFPAAQGAANTTFINDGSGNLSFALPTVLGTVTTGTWNATTIALNHGGTGQTTKAAAFNALSPLTTAGDLLGFDSGNNVRIPVGTDGFALVANSGSTGGFAWTDFSTLFLPISGGTLTGALTLAADAANALEPTTLQQIQALGAGLLAKSGGTMTGDLILNADPTDPLGAATKEYVDDAVVAASGFVKISSQTGSGQTNIVFDNLTDVYSKYEIVLEDVNPTTGGTANLQMRVSQDNGSTFPAGTVSNAYNSLYLSGGVSTNTPAINSAVNTVILTSVVSHPTSTGNITGSIFLYNPAATGETSTFTSKLVYNDVNGLSVTDGSAKSTLTGLNAVELTFNSDTVASGTFTLYGYAA